MNYINPHEFYLETNEKLIDVDGQHGGQCWDLFAYFTKKYCNKTFSCIKTGYVIDLWDNFKECGLEEYFDKVESDFQDGDWLIYRGPCMITSKSHIAMYRMTNPDGTHIILTQNPNGNPKYTHQMVCSTQGIVGALRPKTNLKKDKIKELQQVLNEQYNCGLAVDGSFGPLTTKACLDNYLFYLKNAPIHIKWLQTRLTELGYTCAIDGSFGPQTLDSLIKFQKDRGLSVDGFCGSSTSFELVK